MSWNAALHFGARVRQDDACRPLARAPGGAPGKSIPVYHGGMRDMPIPISVALFLCLGVAGCSGRQTASPFPVREVAADEASTCRELGIIAKRWSQYRSESFNRNKAMSLAIEDVQKAGADAYYVLDTETSEGVTQVIVKALRCG